MLDQENLSGKTIILLKLKLRLYRALILAIATYASETWAITVNDENKLFVFEMQCLRSIIGVSRLNRIRNEEIRIISGSEKTILDVIKDKTEMVWPCMSKTKWFLGIIILQTRFPSSKTKRKTTKKIGRSHQERYRFTHLDCWKKCTVKK